MKTYIKAENLTEFLKQNPDKIWMIVDDLVELIETIKTQNDKMSSSDELSLLDKIREKADDFDMVWDKKPEVKPNEFEEVEKRIISMLENKIPKSVGVRQFYLDNFGTVTEDTVSWINTPESIASLIKERFEYLKELKVEVNEEELEVIEGGDVIIVMVGNYELILIDIE